MKHLILFLFIYSCSYSYLQIYPTIFDKRIDGEGRNQRYELSNTTKEKVRYIFYIESIKNSQDMSKWIEFFPKTMTLNPGEKKELNLFIQAPNNTKKGEYLAVLGVKELPIITESDIKNRKNTLNILTNLKIEIAGFVDEIPIILKNTKIILNENSKKLDGIIENNSIRRATLWFYLKNSKNKKEYFLGVKRILAGQSFNLSTFDKIKDRNILKDYDEIIIKHENEIIKRIKI